MKVSSDQIYDVVSRIPRERVATYGQIAQLARNPGPASEDQVCAGKWPIKLRDVSMKD